MTEINERKSKLLGSGDIVASFDDATAVSAVSQLTPADDHGENEAHEGRDDDD